MKTKPNGDNGSTRQRGKPVKSRRILFIRLAVVAAFLAALLWFALPPSEPKCQGLTLSQWLERYWNDFDAEPQRREAVDAVIHIGSNAVPCLLRWLTASDSNLKQNLEVWLNKHSPIKVSVTERYVSHSDRAFFGFEILGAQAQSAIPELERLMGNTNTAQRAAHALCRIGSAATPALLRGLTNSNPDIRSATAYAIWLRSKEIDMQSGKPAVQALHLPVSPVLILLRYSKPDLRVVALRDLQQPDTCKTVKADMAVPLLIEQLKGLDPECRMEAANALRGFGLKATNAVPALMAELQDQDENARIAATNALKKIDPEVARTAGVK